jgi:lantibiotic biosynthesis protein
LVIQLLELFNTDYILGFRDLERDSVPVDQPSLLTGAAGVAMTLLAAATNVEPKWDRILLIS